MTRRRIGVRRPVHKDEDPAARESDGVPTGLSRVSRGKYKLTHIRGESDVRLFLRWLEIRLRKLGASELLDRQARRETDFRRALVATCGGSSFGCNILGYN